MDSSRKPQNRIFSIDSPKAVKALAYGYLNAIHYMAPSDLSGVNLCPKATPICKWLCLGWNSGQASMVKDLEHDTNSVRQSRIDKAKRFMADRQAYMRDVALSIAAAWRKAGLMGLKLCVRMNGSTDIAWEGIGIEVGAVLAAQLARILLRTVTPGRYRNLMGLFSDIQFIDYTKVASRLQRALPVNYHLTLSRTEDNDAEVCAAIRRGQNVAVVFEQMPDAWHGMPVIDGTKHDLRHLDPRGVIVGLTPLGSRAKRDASGFVVRAA